MRLIDLDLEQDWFENSEIYFKQNYKKSLRFAIFNKKQYERFGFL